LSSNKAGDQGRAVLRAAMETRAALREWRPSFSVHQTVCLLLLRKTGAPFTHVCLNILEHLAVPPELSISTSF